MTAEWIVGLTCDWPDCSSRIQTPSSNLSGARDVAAYGKWWTHLHGLDLCGHHPEAVDHPPVIVEANASADPGQPPTGFAVSCTCGWSSDRQWRSEEYACWEWLEHLPPEDTEVCAQRCAYDMLMVGTSTAQDVRTEIRMRPRVGRP